MYDEFDNKENEDRYDPKQPSAEDEVKTGQMYGEEDQLSENEEVQASTAEETEASAESGEQSSVYHYSYERGEQAEPTGSTQNSQQYGSQSIMQKSILTKKRKDTVSTIRMASITREKTDGMTAFTKIIRSRNIRWKAAGKSRLAQARRSQLLSDVQPYSVWYLV